MNNHWVRKREILALLNAKNFVSGEWLANELGLSRMAINQHINSLADYGIEIFSVKGKGYKLATPITLVDEQKLINGIDNRCFYFDEITSTNSFLLNHYEDLKSGDICVSEYQSAGRGRRGRQWVSPYAHHLYASLFWQFDQPPAKTVGLSLVIACSIVEGLSHLSVTGLGLKWPNDIYLEGKKLAGILIEMVPTPQSSTSLVIGFGINLNMPLSQGELIDQPWSDLSGLMEPLNKTELLICLHKQLKQDIQTFAKFGLAPFIKQWAKYDLYDNQPIRLIMSPNEVCGLYKGIDEQGAVLIETEDSVKAYIGGEISLRSA
ncbi:bifunctional biotin--[acetyl-CoA-carboxylase] ligase/biotin operon repressor BirA [Shewanella aestuarii]|uniref:Bifunctional ligase/repressor BirA n=1 Tax=Shewanella aestuarii TaxID=1028752 RepID=A0A6G9QFD3_9GAMM|nr:bifunctional biotin--[acetyl-CoA-carboxylase] ligase/biotin operon repressor BirA [Shewanella aestuarii]QIR13176.1 bifunctional biotin--[acetyl-CoA-carboxylase] ligase/biotin operon repressor BirA [Shewanella aestuarii]